MRRRASAYWSGCTSGVPQGDVPRRLQAEVLEHGRRDVDDAAGQALEPDHEHRHDRVAGVDRAVAPAAGVVATAEIGELEAGRGRDEHLAGVRVRERRVRTSKGVRLVEDRLVSGRRPAAAHRGEGELLAAATSDRRLALAEERDLGRGLVVEAPGELAGVERAVVEAVDHPGP